MCVAFTIGHRGDRLGLVEVAFTMLNHAVSTDAVPDGTDVRGGAPTGRDGERQRFTGAQFGRSSGARQRVR